jgi:hypothetical protein
MWLDQDERKISINPQEIKLSELILPFILHRSMQLLRNPTDFAGLALRKLNGPYLHHASRLESIQSHHAPLHGKMHRYPRR